ncbi:MAG: amylo-alpha-1,6-glucosidase [Thermodesulfovibrionales bacterium]
MHVIAWPDTDASNLEPLVTREWIVTNGLGGYASGTISGVTTRRYHGLLIAALAVPLGRMLMLSNLSEQLRLQNGKIIRLTGEEFVGGLVELEGARLLSEFRLEMGLPVWRYEFEGFALEKRILMPHTQNTVYVTYRLISGEGRVRLKLRPSMHFRSHDAPTNLPITEPYVLTAVEDRLEFSGPSPLPPLRMLIYGDRRVFTVEGKTLRQLRYRVEESRGYESTGELWSAGYFGVDIAQGLDATLVASTEKWDTIRDLSPGDALNAELERRRRLTAIAHPNTQGSMGAELVLAADQFIVIPEGRVEDVRARATGDEVRTVIAGYHWFTDWGRDTMISLEGLTLTTGRHIEAGYILRTFAHYVRDGLIPNLFPEGKKEGLYHTADATLWFFHALYRYVEVTGDRETLRLILPKLPDIIEHHLRGTRFGIGVDTMDGLLKQGTKEYPLTWMDAKVDDFIVTPRRGKAVEINALWYNALRLMENWVREERGEDAATSFGEHAKRARKSFNERFWCAEHGYLYDVVDGEQGDDSACRPNQLFAISLPFPILDQSRWEPVVEIVRERLLTPAGLRSLAPGHPDYKSKYFGDLRARDAAYHQGTVWAWLIGPFVDAWLKVHPDDRAGAHRLLEGFNEHLTEACIGSISEVFDAEEPFHPRGCVAQAWSVAEVLRCWAGTAELTEKNPPPAE